MQFTTFLCLRNLLFKVLRHLLYYALCSLNVGLSTSMSRLLSSVVKQRGENWGRSVSPAQTPPVTPSPGDFTNEPVFFSLSGQRITREQAGFG